MGKEKVDELDELASRFIIGHKRLSKRQKHILERIENLKKQEDILGNRRKRIRDLINTMYGNL